MFLKYVKSIPTKCLLTKPTLPPAPPPLPTPHTMQAKIAHFQVKSVPTLNVCACGWEGVGGSLFLLWNNKGLSSSPFRKNTTEDT